MFEKLVVSTLERRKHTTSKFFVGTLALYATVLAGAFVVSLLVSDPRLADSGNILTLVSPPLPSGGTPPRGPRPPRPHHDSLPDPNHVERLEDLLSHRNSPRPPMPSAPLDWRSEGEYIPGSGTSDGPPGIGPGPRGSEGNLPVAPPPAPEPTRQRPQSPAVDERRPVPVPSTVLQGKAIERVVPVYPELARRMRLEGNVSVEVIISPEGRVESARVVSGHAMLLRSAVDAARGWRFGPTLLNGAAVRVSGVITFVFKLNE